VNVESAVAADAPHRDARVALSYPVHFGRRLNFAYVPADSYRLVGKGQVEFDGALLRFSGKQRGMLSSSEQHEIPLDRIFNVVRAGTSMRLDVQLDAGQTASLGFTMNTAKDAAELSAELPVQKTQKFIQQQAELVEFAQRLNRLSPRAWLTPGLVAINVLVFIAMCLGGAGVITADPAVAVRWGSNYGPLTMTGEWWRLFTSMFIHFGILHIAMNMWALYVTGRMVERLFGSTRFLVLYLFAGLCGSMTSLLWNPTVNSAGASAAIFGVFGGMLAFVVIPRNGVPSAVMAANRNSTIIYAAYALFYGFAHSGIDNAAHIGGLLGGFLIGLTLARPLDDEHRADPDGARFMISATVATVLIAMLAYPLFNPRKIVAQEQQLRRALYDVSVEEPIALARMETLRDQAKLETNEGIANQIETDIHPLWLQMQTEVLMASVPKESKLFDLRMAFFRYLGDRLAWCRILSADLRHPDQHQRRMAELKSVLNDTRTDLDSIANLEKAAH
jgi:rhomboid protease GluP